MSIIVYVLYVQISDTTKVADKNVVHVTKIIDSYITQLSVHIYIANVKNPDLILHVMLYSL